jgi:hypothetical protein
MTFPASPPLSRKTAIFTSCAANYIPKARVLGSSVQHFHSDIDLYLLLVDDVPPHLDIANEPFDFVIRAQDLPIPDFNRWIFKHRIVEACTAVKPFMLKHLLEKGYEQVFYFDPDIALFFPLTEMLAEFDYASILLTPHQCTPDTEEDAIRDNELCSLKHGVYNFGYVGVLNDAEGNRYAKWWADRCYLACFDDIANGNFTDQKWNDLVPALFKGVKVLQSPVYNVATWNYSQRKIEGTLEEGFTVNGLPLVFHHFTGYDSGAHHLMLQKYGKEMPAATELSQWYEASCQHFAQSDLAAVKWKYHCYDTGETILPHHRKLYRSRDDLQEAFAHPFSTQPEGRYRTSLAAWLKAEGFWDAPSFELTETAPRPFAEFLAATEAQMRGYLTRTARLTDWQKKLLKTLNHAFFALLALPLKRRVA